MWSILSIQLHSNLPQRSNSSSDLLPWQTILKTLKTLLRHIQRSWPHHTPPHNITMSAIAGPSSAPFRRAFATTSARLVSAPKATPPPFSNDGSVPPETVQGEPQAQSMVNSLQLINEHAAIALEKPYLVISGVPRTYTSEDVHLKLRHVGALRFGDLAQQRGGWPINSLYVIVTQSGMCLSNSCILSLSTAEHYSMSIHYHMMSARMTFEYPSPPVTSCILIFLTNR